jgi:hypothetical protein
MYRSYSYIAQSNQRWIYAECLLTIGRPREGREPLMFGHIGVKVETENIFWNRWLQLSSILSL